MFTKGCFWIAAALAFAASALGGGWVWSLIGAAWVANALVWGGDEEAGDEE